MCLTTYSDATDEIVRSVKQCQARQESKDLSKVTIRGQLSNLKSGWWNGGLPPYGYDLQYVSSQGALLFTVRFLESGEKQVFDNRGHPLRTLPPGERVPKAETDKTRLVPSTPERQQLVRRIFDMYVNQGLGFKSIARKLNDEGIPSPRNGNHSKNCRAGWSLSTIRSIILNPAYTGDMVWNRKAKGKFHSIVNGHAQERKGFPAQKERWNDKADWEVKPNTHPALIDRKTFDEADRLRTERSLRRGGAPYRSGRAKTSPYLLTSLILCTRCGHRFHGCTANSTIHRKDGSKIKTLYYACAGAVSKGVCERKLVRKDELEREIRRRIKIRVEEFRKVGGDKTLKRILADELKAGYQEPAAQHRVVKKKIDEIDRSVDRLVESLTPTNKEFVDPKLVSLKRDRDRLEQELDRVKALPDQAVDIDALANEIIASMGPFEEVFREGTLEEKKEFISLFVERIELDTEERRATVYLRKFPAPTSLDLGKPAFEMAPGVRCKHQKRPFPPVDVVEVSLVRKGSTLIPVAA
ncbi:MAG: recombinase family protein [Candidatus Krumholzibacteria bacterium]